MQLAIVDAMPVWHPKLVLNLGVGWGARSYVGHMLQKLGDVMVACDVHGLGEKGKIDDQDDIRVPKQPSALQKWLKRAVQTSWQDWRSDVQPDVSWYPHHQVPPSKYKAFAGLFIAGRYIAETEL